MAFERYDPVTVTIRNMGVFPATIIDGLEPRIGADGRKLWSAYSLLYLPHDIPTIGAAIPPAVTLRTARHEILDNQEVINLLISNPNTRNEADYFKGATSGNHR